jgi:NADH-quinone oxidoreductase subunit A
MPFDFATILIFLIVGFLFVWSMMFISGLVQRKNPTAAKLSTYECGETPVGSSWVQFNIRFYVIALIFIIFDVEIAFIYPCAVVFKDWVLSGRGMTAFIEIALFMVILLAGLAYVWVKGDLNWVKEISEEGPEEAAEEARQAQIA